MSKRMPLELYRTAESLSVNKIRSRFIISRTFDCLIVEFETLFGEGYTDFYKDFPEIPSDFSASADGVFATECGHFLWLLTSGGKYKPVRRVKTYN